MGTPKVNYPKDMQEPSHKRLKTRLARDCFDLLGISYEPRQW